MCLLYCVLRKNTNIARASGRGSRGSKFTTCLVTLCAHVGHHQLQHFSDALSLPALPNCFVLERKHKGIKAVGDVTVTGPTWDKSVLRETTVHHLFALERNTFSKEAAVEDSHPPSRALKKSLGEWFGPLAEGCLTGPVARISEWERVSTGDVVVYSTQSGHHRVGQIILHVEFHGVVATLVECYKWEADEWARASKHAPMDRGEWIPTASILGAAIHSLAKTPMRVIPPLHVTPRWAAN